MSYLYTFGKTKSAVNLMVILNELGDDKLIKQVSSILLQFFKKLRKLEKLELDNQLNHWIYLKLKDEYFRELPKTLPSSVSTYVKNVVLTELKIWQDCRKTGKARRKIWIK